MPLSRLLKVLALAVAISLGSPGAALAQSGGFYYTVQKSESVAAVAGRFGIPSSELARANKLRSDARLAKGSRLWVPRRGTVAAPKPSIPTKQTPLPKPKTVVQAKPSAPVARPTAPRVTAKPAAASGTHVVQPGESLWGIANRHGMTASELGRLNGISSNARLEVGQVLYLAGSAEKETPGGGIAKPEPVVSVPGGGAAGTPPSSAGAETMRPSRRGYIWPLEGRILRQFTNTADEKYTGIDIAAPRGTEVRAAKDGKVVYAGDTIPSYGRMVIVGHDGDIASCYAQLDRVLVKQDQTVRRGQVIGRSGDPGRGRESYLHFEIRRNGDAIDPEPFLP